jgi:hypothetical protein
MNWALDVGRSALGVLPQKYRAAPCSPWILCSFNASSRVVDFISKIKAVAAWFWYAVVAAVLYGAHQIFTRLASERIGDGLGGFVVEASAAMFILLYLAFLWLAGRWNQKFSMPGFNYSLLAGICVGAGTIAFLLPFQKGDPLPPFQPF